MLKGSPPRLRGARVPAFGLSQRVARCQVPKWAQFSRSPTVWTSCSVFLRSVSGPRVQPTRSACARDAVAVARILNAQGWRVGLGEIVSAAATAYEGDAPAVTGETVANVTAFIWDRVAGLLEQEGVPVTLVRAVTADAPPVITASRRAHLLKALSQEGEFESLLQLYKRAANLAKQLDGETEINPKRFSSPYEQPLYEAIPGAKGALEELLAAVRQDLGPWDLGSGPARELTALPGLPDILALKAPLDAFLDNVLVMVDENAVRRNRLALLDEVSGSLRELGQLEVLEGLSS